MNDVNLQRRPIAAFDDLVATALTEPAPCRLLTVVVQAETAFRRRGAAAEPMLDEGCLAPVMMRDWPVTPALSADAIARAADEVTHDWRFLMASVMPGRYGRAPSDEACERHLERMVKALSVGEGIEDYVFFDRAGVPVRITPASR